MLELWSYVYDVFIDIIISIGPVNQVFHYKLNFIK